MTVQQTCFICFVQAALLVLNQQHIYLFLQIQTNQTGVQPQQLYFPLQSKLVFSE